MQATAARGGPTGITAAAAASAAIRRRAGRMGNTPEGMKELVRGYGTSPVTSPPADRTPLATAPMMPRVPPP